MQVNKFIILAIAIFGNVVYSADSDGKEFVFNFMQFSDFTNPAITTTVVVIPSYNNSICTFTYTQQSDNKVVSITKAAFYGKTNEFAFDSNEVLLATLYSYPAIKNYANKDFRIFASCTSEVRLIGRFSDPNHGYGDMFLIPSIETAGDTYIFSMPTGLHGIKGFISILPISQQGSIAINIVGHATGFFYSNETIQYNTTKGEKQHYISVYPLNQLDYTSSITISSTSKFLISFMTPYIVSTDEADGECGFPCYQDYVTFFPSPVFFTECNGVLSPPDQRIITNDFTTRLYVSPPKKSSDCDEIFIMTIYNKEDNVNGDEEIITAIGSSTIDLRDKSEMGSSTSAGQMPIYRLGSARDYFDSLYEYGHFLHLVPSTEEWVTGKSQFYSLAKDCIIEFYTDQAGSDVNSILFDGKVLTKYGYIKDPMNYFKKTYFHFQVAVHGYGLHTLENDGKYVLYVICKHVNSVSDAAGYLTGFNRRKTQN